MSNQKKFSFIITCAILAIFILVSKTALTQETASVEDQANTTSEKIPSKELVQQAWEASSKKDVPQIEKLVEQALQVYGVEAKQQQASLTGLPSLADAPRYQSLNDVGTLLFIRAEAYMNQGQTEKATVLFQEIIDDYGFAQAWDPRGWYWSVAEKSQASINVLSGKEVEEESVKAMRTKPSLATKGTEPIVGYAKYGEFVDVGKSTYQYVIKDLNGLAAAVGEGIYPNKGAIFNNPRLKEVRKEGRLKGSHWDFVNTDDLEAAYFKWVTAPESEGVKLFYIGFIFEKAGMWYEALRAYHALVVHFPGAVGWTYWQTPWYPGQAAIAKIRYILRLHPELNLTDKWMKIEIKNGYDNDVKNDVIIPNPGKIVSKGIVDKVLATFKWENKVKLGKVVKVVGQGDVRLLQYENHHWQLYVKGRPYMIKGITYSPTKVGQSPDNGTLTNWMLADTNNNGRIDGPYDSWVDKNRNNEQDADEPVVGDFELLKEMGANTLRIYYHPMMKPDKKLLRAMFEQYGFRVAMGNFLGKYAIDSGATWAEGTDYENFDQRTKMLEAVKAMVMEFKDEPYILMWILGNENNYGVACNADKKPEAYFQFVDEVAQWIKSVDPNHLVAVSNGDTLFLDVFAKNSSHIDVFGANVYRGDYGFGSFWDQVMDATGKPAIITEYGSPAFAKHLTLEEGEQAQANYHYGNWRDIKENSAGTPRGVGNALGGFVFEWMDEWWKNYEPYRHDKKSDAVGPFPGGYYYEEWFGLVSQGNGQHSPFLRQLRPVYYLYKNMWHTTP